MSFPPADFTTFSKSVDAYKQYTPDDPIQNSIYDTTMECDAGLRDQNKIILLIDSKDRPHNEEPNKYSIKLKKVYKDVISVELVKANIPNSDYIINEHNNTFYFQDNAKQSGKCDYNTLQLPIGNYPICDKTKDSIISLLQAGLNLVNSKNKYTVTVDWNTQQITIEQTSGSGVFNILFQAPKTAGKEASGNQLLKNNMSKILGFKPIDHIDKLSYTSEYAYDLKPARYITIRIKGMERIDSPHDATQDAFCILSLESRKDSFLLSDECGIKIDKDEYTKFYNPPLGKLDRLDIEIFDADGHLMNFRGKDHYLLFEITSLTQFSKYSRPATTVNRN